MANADRRLAEVAAREVAVQTREQSVQRREQLLLDITHKMMD